VGTKKYYRFSATIVLAIGYESGQGSTTMLRQDKYFCEYVCGLVRTQEPYVLTTFTPQIQY